jgi:hypothetical protein
VSLVRDRLAAVLPAARFLGGTDGGFCQLNRSSLDSSGLDGVAYAMNPQEHAADDLSLFETLAAQGETVRSARALHPGLDLVVGPVTLKPRFNVIATEPEPDRPGVLPPPVDVRQRSLLAAAWTVGSLKYIAEAGADAVTYCETTGWRGLIERESGPPAPDLFPSRPGEVFPLYHVFADAADLSGAFVPVESDQPLAAVALAAETEDGLTALVANLRPEPTEVEIVDLPRGSRRIRRLNAETAAVAATEPSRFRSEWHELDGDGEAMKLRLEPYEVARVEVTRPGQAASKEGDGSTRAPA